MFEKELGMDEYFVDSSKLYRQSLRPLVRRPTTYKPNTAYAMLNFVSSIEFTKDRHIGLFSDDEVRPGCLSPTLVPPDVMLDMSKGTMTQARPITLII